MTTAGNFPDVATVVGGAAAPLEAALVRRVVGHVLAAERRQAAIAVSFLGPARMRRLNAEHLHHDWATDVITFALPQPDGTIAGDVYVCRYVAAREARARGHSVRNELVRLIVHGTLHVLGHDHPEGHDRDASPMWLAQERHVEALT